MLMMNITSSRHAPTMPMATGCRRIKPPTARNTLEVRVAAFRPARFACFAALAYRRLSFRFCQNRDRGVASEPGVVVQGLLPGQPGARLGGFVPQLFHPAVGMGLAKPPGGAGGALGGHFSAVGGLGAHVLVLHTVQLFVGVTHGGIGGFLDRPQGNRAFEVFTAGLHLLIENQLPFCFPSFLVKIHGDAGPVFGGEVFLRILQFGGGTPGAAAGCGQLFAC